MKSKPVFGRRRCVGWSLHPCKVWFVPDGPRHKRCNKCRLEHTRLYERMRSDKKTEGPSIYRVSTKPEFGSVRQARDVESERVYPKTAARFIDAIINLS